METHIIFHVQIRSDLRGILDYYRRESGEDLAGRFYDAFMLFAEKALNTPKRFHFASNSVIYRRVAIKGFPYHFLYRETHHGIRILVLRHDKRKPTYGLKRI